MTFFILPATVLAITKPKVNINNEITAPELLVIDERGSRLGVMKREEALAMARERNLDLIEIAPHLDPPVVRIMEFDKFRYEQEKKQKKRRAEQRGQGLKQIQISIREAKNDLLRKVGKVDEFLAENNQVEVLLVLRGRERGNKDFARKKLEEFLTLVTAEHRVISEPKFAGRGFSVKLAKK